MEPASEQRRERAIAAFNAENARDPRSVSDDAGVQRPRELVYAERLAAWVERLAPQASEALRLASHCQHLRRWEMPRSEHEAGRIGYLKWRKALARFHADQAGQILQQLGYEPEVLRAVRQIQLKQGLVTDPDVQTMEDALCLSFLQHELEAFSEEHPDEKVIDIIAKTWAKMSERGQRWALSLPLSARTAALVQGALVQAALARPAPGTTPE